MAHQEEPSRIGFLAIFLASFYHGGTGHSEHQLYVVAIWPRLQHSFECRANKFDHCYA